MHARNISESREIDRNERFPVETVHRGWLHASSKFDEKFMKSRIYGRRRTHARLTRDGGNDDGGARECRLRREKRWRTRNTKFSSCQRRHEERRWNFYNDTFCARDYFRDVPAGIERGGGARVSARVFARGTVGNEFTPRHHVLPTFFFHAIQWLANVENMLWKLAYGGVLLSVTYQRDDRGGA